MWTLVRRRLHAFQVWVGDERRLRQAIRELEAFDDRRLRDLGLNRETIQDAVRLGRRPTTDTTPTSRRQDRAAAA
jgi:uncharacterized protein YjiS (DUF1127 family)